MDWLIIYSDGSTYCSHDGAWEDAPAWDAQIVIVENDVVGRELLSRRDFFIFHEEQPLNVDDTGFLDYMTNVFGFAKVNRAGYPTRFILTETGALVDRDGLIIKATKAGILKVGRYLPTPKWRTLIAQALTESGFPHKSAWLPNEPRPKGDGDG